MWKHNTTNFTVLDDSFRWVRMSAKAPYPLNVSCQKETKCIFPSEELKYEVYWSVQAWMSVFGLCAPL